MDNEDNVERHFSLEDLRKLFELNEETDSDTHDRSAMGGRCHLGGGTYKQVPPHIAQVSYTVIEVRVVHIHCMPLVEGMNQTCYRTGGEESMMCEQ